MRGYNQAEKLAESIGRESGIPVYAGIVKRVKNTKPMKLLGVGERSANLKNAFIMAANDVKFNKVLLVDDIFTTGATIDAVADILMDAGVSYVYYVALSIGTGC
jgi:ComF family protein